MNILNVPISLHVFSDNFVCKTAESKCLHDVTNSNSYALDKDVHTCLKPWNRGPNEIYADFKLRNDCISMNNSGLFIFEISFNQTVDCNQLQHSVWVSDKTHQEFSENDCKFYKPCVMIEVGENSRCQFSCKNFLLNSAQNVVSLLVTSDIVSNSEETIICEMDIVNSTNHVN